MTPKIDKNDPLKNAQKPVLQGFFQKMPFLTPKKDPRLKGFLGKKGSKIAKNDPPPPNRPKRGQKSIKMGHFLIKIAILASLSQIVPENDPFLPPLPQFS